MGIKFMYSAIDRFGLLPIGAFIEDTAVDDYGSLNKIGPHEFIGHY